MAGGTGGEPVGVPVVGGVRVVFRACFVFGKNSTAAAPVTVHGVSVSIPVPELFDQVEAWGWCYLLTVSDDQRPHLLAVRPQVVGEGTDRRLRFVTGGGTACRNATTRPAVTVLFPPGPHSDGYSLVVDGEAGVDDAIVDVRPDAAVLHRPAS
jgi:hypothetical protein